jgi:pyruvate/2-oxoglutarate/acetoin dehydrogenase E1 component/TPP-dependent pyruvate/acetoin dehydrogenase alpha subunit
MKDQKKLTINISFEDFKKEILQDYSVAVTSRECSILGRREVLTGKAKFGIFGDGKEIPQLAWAKSFKKGDFRSGYYRDQTFMMALNLLSIEQFFAGLYAHTDLKFDPMSAGRQMGGHFSTHSLDENFQWKDLTSQMNSSSDISPTAAQMPRLLGLAQASKMYRALKIEDSNKFSKSGNEIAWGSIGNASTSEGLFFETINAAGVLQVPMVISVWDDDYGISVHAKYHTTKESISEVLKGFQKNDTSNGFEIIVVKGWDYAALVNAYDKASESARISHTPVLIHVTELTQPQGHSTSGSHERYKSADRLNWERDFDCNLKMREWIISNEISTEEDLISIEKDIKKKVRAGRDRAWKAYIEPIISDKNAALDILKSLAQGSNNKVFIQREIDVLNSIEEPLKKNILITARRVLRYCTTENSVHKNKLQSWINQYFNREQPKYSSLLYSQSAQSATAVVTVEAKYNSQQKRVDGRVVLRDNFDALLAKYSNLLIFGEDSGAIGDVNQGLEGLQFKFGEHRVADTGIREATIIGQGIGMALRGLRPIAEIQYLDYMVYALQTLSDDLATLHYRTAGKQKAPLIIRTRGHRLEGIWHSGSQLGGILNLIRGIYVLVPRNMTKAAGFYNSLLESDQTALVVECLNGYRLKEKLPTNLGEFKTQIGVAEILKTGDDITLVSYGSTLRLVEQAAKELLEIGIDAEVIDIQSLIPLDTTSIIGASVQKTNRLLIIDEDVPGGASAYILNEVLENQNIFPSLDSAPKTLTAKAHRPAYGSDGDYFSKPSLEDIFETVYTIFNEVDPKSYPNLR